mgnify:CR=1 FL=1
MIRLVRFLKKSAATKCAVFTLVFLTFIAPELSHSFGVTGHRVIGKIAENHLTDKAKMEVEKLLGPQSLAQVSTWADEIRSDPNWRKASPWHYINIEDDQSIEQGLSNSKENILEAIGRFTSVLRDKKASHEQRAEALKFLVHFVGDLHQPLHVGRAGDRGGNSISVEWFGDRMNLHRVWDSAMIDHQKLSYTEFTEFIDHASDQQVRDWQSTGPSQWAQESKDYRNEVYDFGNQRDPEKIFLGYQYIFHNDAFLKQRLLQAGIRLAGLLNAAFE